MPGPHIFTEQDLIGFKCGPAGLHTRTDDLQARCFRRHNYRRRRHKKHDDDVDDDDDCDDST